jgi:carboxyl-terminal processing protease
MKLTNMFFARLGRIGKSFAIQVLFIVWTLQSGASAQISSSAAPEKNAAILAPKEIQRNLNADIVDHLTRRHYLKIDIDDDLSSKVLYRYLDDLDPSHSYFYAKDIEEFERKYKFKLDDSFKKNDLEPAFAIFNRYQQRLIERLTASIARLERGLDDMDFNVEESLQIDRKDQPWPDSESAMEDLWRKRLKSNIITLKLVDEPLEEIREKLLKRYRNQLNRVSQNNADDVYQFYINSLAQSIDPHTQYFSPHRTENFNINMSLSLEGIGAVLQTEDEYTKVVRLIAGGPAERSKLLGAADRIVGVAQGADGEMIEVLGWRLDEVVNMIRGPKGSLVRLQIIPVDAADEHQTKEISIVRDTVKLEEQSAKKRIIEVQRANRKYKVGVIDIPTFYADFKGMNAGKPDYKSTTKDVEQLLLELKEENVQGIIIDLRDNGGGSLQEANSLTGLFIGLGPTVQVRNANGRIDIIRDHDPLIIYSGPLVVLVNRMSASASEIFAGAIQDYKRGFVLGEQTFGKGTVQSLLPLDQGQLKATTAKYYRISGQSTQHKGIIPDLDYPSLYSFEEIGESALPEALAWDQINSIPYQPYYNIDDNLVLKLQNMHMARNRTSLDYQYLLDRRERNEEMRLKKEVSLSEQTRRKERDEAEQWLLQMENKLRLSKGEPPLEKIPDMAEEEGLGIAHADNELKDDPLLKEAGEVLVDFVSLGQDIVYKH